jgi:hypothetical protein
MNSSTIWDLTPRQSVERVREMAAKARATAILTAVRG